MRARREGDIHAFDKELAAASRSQFGRQPSIFLCARFNGTGWLPAIFEYALTSQRLFKFSGLLAAIGAERGFVCRI